jgi:hypothetical protein
LASARCRTRSSDRLPLMARIITTAALLIALGHLSGWFRRPPSSHEGVPWDELLAWATCLGAGAFLLIDAIRHRGERP